ncbi:MAG: restriction endonuclease subunit S [Pseudomonadota bacterium]
MPLESLLRDSKSIAVGVMYPGPDTAGGTPLIKVGDIKDGAIPAEPTYCISAETNQEHKRTQLEGDELLITLVGNPGECVVVKPEMIGWNPARAIAVIRLQDTRLRTYLKAVLESAAGKHLIDAVLNTTVQKTLNLKDIRRLPIPLPSEQMIRGISSISEALAERVTLLRETNATLEAIAQALFKSWFVDFDPVRAKQAGLGPEGMDEATAALFPDAFEASALGLVPKGWAPVRLDTLLELAYGKALKAENRTAGPVPVYGSGGITGWHDEPLVKTPSVVVGRKGTVGSLYWESRPFYPIDTVFYIKTALPLTYCHLLLGTLGLSNMNTDAAVPGLNRENVYRLNVPNAPFAVVVAFDLLAKPLRDAMDHNEQQAQTLAALRDALLPRLISGQLRLPEAQHLIEEATA